MLLFGMLCFVWVLAVQINFRLIYRTDPGLFLRIIDLGFDDLDRLYIINKGVPLMYGYTRYRLVGKLHLGGIFRCIRIYGKSLSIFYFLLFTVIVFIYYLNVLSQLRSVFTLKEY